MSNFTALGAYIFAGGFTEGVKKHFTVLGHLEEGPYGVPSAKLNFPDLEILVGQDNWGPLLKKAKRARVDFVYGNPPCAAWSALNGKKTKAGESWRTDERIHCTLRHFTLLEELKPKVWVWESVDRAFSTGRPFVDDLAVRAHELGYAVTHLRFDAQYVGGMHRRQRYFMVVHKVAIDWDELIKFVDAPPAGKVLTKAPRKTADDKLFIPLPTHHVRVWKQAKPGEALQSAWDRTTPASKLKIREASTGKKFIVGRPAFKNIVINPDKVAPTVVGLNLIHHKEPRHLTIGEMKALCGYPAAWKIQPMKGGGRWDFFTRAVMPPIGNWLSGIVHESLKAGKRAPKKIEIVDLRKRSIIRTDVTEETLTPF